MATLVVLAGCGEGGPAEKPGDKPAKSVAAKADPAAEARRVLAESFERWKMAKDWNPDDPANAQRIHFTRPSGMTAAQNSILRYNIGTPRVLVGEEAGVGTTDPSKVERRFEFPVTYTPNDTSSRKEYEIESEWWVLQLSDAKAAWVVNQVSAERKQPGH
jgi:hypothetical protein